MDGPAYRQSASRPKLSHIANIKILQQHPHSGYATLRDHSAAERGSNDRTIRARATPGR
jgi:hypothetical protein